MYLTNSALMRQADSAAINGRGIPSLELMESAASAIAERALRVAGNGGTVVAVCGSGNNGGDGIAAAWLLKRQKCQVRAFLTGDRAKLTADSAEMERRLLACGVVLEDLDPNDAAMAEAFADAAVIIDAVFGIGLSRNVTGRALDAIRLMNASPAPVIAADIASGVEADTGRILGEAVSAAETVTFSLPKPGHYVEPGCIYCGKLLVHEIGIPPDLLEGCKTKYYAMADGELHLPRRKKLTHKGDYGKLLIIGGCVGYTGAPSLCARAAVRAGAGLVYLGVPKAIYDITAVKNDEAMPFPLADDGKGCVSEAAIPVISEKLKVCDTAVIGPGMGRGDGALRAARELVKAAKIPVVVDADGLYALAQDMSVVKNAACPLVLTPHEAEFVRMGGILTGDRISDARAFAQKNSCVLVLKGYRTMAAFPDGKVYITTHGNPGMAKGGSGDVLAGVLGAMLGQLSLKDAVKLAVFTHSLAGDLCRDKLGEYAMMAGDIIETLPQALKILTGE